MHMSEKLTHNKPVSGAIFVAMSVLLMFIQFPIIPIFPFLKMDFSDVIVLIAFFTLGMPMGILVTTCKVFLHWILMGMQVTGLIGDVASWVSTLAFIIPIYLLYCHKKKWLICFVTGIISLAVIMSLANYFAVMPLYMKVVNLQIGMPLGKYVAMGVLPFNLIKGILNSVVFYLIFRRLKLK